MSQIDLFRPFMAPEAAAAVARMLTPDADGRLYIGEGRRVEEFERAFGELVGASEPPLAVNSCTSALTLALWLAGVGPRDEVISTPITCTATNAAIVMRGATIRWADVDPLTGNIDPESVARAMNDRTKAIVAVDWGGRPCDYAGLRAVAGGRPIIEDAAHALTAPTGGDYVCWSLGPIKHLTSGDGGMLLAPHRQMDRGRLLRWYGLDRRSGSDFRCAQNITEVGTKLHMNDIAASIGLANLPHMSAVVGRHRANARYYQEALDGLPGVTLPPWRDDSAWWLYTILLPDEAERDAFKDYMARRGIATSQVHRINTEHDGFRAVSRWMARPVNAIAFDRRQVSIPVGWWIDDEARARVAGAVRHWAYREAR